MSFNPFCAVFVLYEHILACADLEDCEEDIQLLDGIGATMSEASSNRTKISPFVRKINALNQVTKRFIDERRRAKIADPTVGQTAHAMPPSDMPASAPFHELLFNFDGSTQLLGFIRVAGDPLHCRKLA